MVRGWLNNKFLEVFFQHFGSGLEVDKQRLDFMKLFLDQVDEIKIALTDTDSLNIRRNPEISQLRSEFPGQFARLFDSKVTALVVSVRGLIWVEFLGHGNAGYIYQASNCKFQFDSKVFSGDTSYSGLKHGYNQNNHVERVLHQAGWQQKLIPTLRRYGIQPTNNPYGVAQPQRTYTRW
jgi:hypothetical protein